MTCGVLSEGSLTGVETPGLNQFSSLQINMFFLKRRNAKTSCKKNVLYCKWLHHVIN